MKTIQVLVSDIDSVEEVTVDVEEAVEKVMEESEKTGDALPAFIEVTLPVVRVWLDEEKAVETGSVTVPKEDEDEVEVDEEESKSLNEAFSDIK